MKNFLLLLLLLMPLNVAFAQTGPIVTVGGHSNVTTLQPGEVGVSGCLQANETTGGLEWVPCGKSITWVNSVYWVNDRAQSSGGSAIKCTVTKVYDGDNVGCVAKIGRGKEQYHNFRIVGIDAPEVKGKQPFYTQARDALREAVLGREVTLELRGYDSIWKRNTVRVLVGDEDIGLKQILNGHAWFYPQYARTLTPDQKQSYEDAMTAAKLNKRGIWSRKKPIRPSLWRRGQR